MGGSWQGETDTDVEMVSAICPLCHIMLLDDSEPDLYSDALAAKAAGATVLSMSVTYIGGHISDPGSVLPTVESSGDQGPNVDYEQEPIGNSDITAAGGTTVIPDPRTPRGYDEYAWDGSGSGCSTGFVPSYQVGLNTGCQGRAYADVSAIADPSTGPQVYINGNWGLIGGTSVSAPIIAAYYALLQSQGLRNLSSPAWAYGSASSSLNDIAQDLPASTSWSLGSNGDTESSNWTPSPGSYCTATPNIPLYTAQTGWDGPTGMGSISGDLIEGSPGIGSNGYVANSSSTSFTVDGGVYTNGEATQVYLQYGPTSAYGYQTAPISLSPAYGASSVSLGVTNTASNGNFHYRIVAVNGSGTSYGYDETVAGDPWDNN